MRAPARAHVHPSYCAPGLPLEQKGAGDKRRAIENENRERFAERIGAEYNTVEGYGDVQGKETCDGFAGEGTKD